MSKFVETQVFRNRFRIDANPAVQTHYREAMSLQARVVMELAGRWGAVAGAPDGEDSAGRSKLRLQEPRELVDRAVEVVEAAFEKCRERDWIVGVPSLEGLYEDEQDKEEV